jgi:FKBP-type peptidyl-prolyl cis-trans isomerase FkpA
MSKQTLYIVALLAVIFVALATIYRGPQSDVPDMNTPPQPQTQKPASQPASKPGDMAKPAPAEKVKVEHLKVGSGPLAKDGQEVSVNYALTLADGTKVDSSYDSGQPLSFTLGAPGMIDGFQQAVRTMHVGGKCRATIPPSLGYGAQGKAPRVPPNATLIFELELLNAK